MCSIAGAASLSRQPVPRLDRALAALSHLIAHRGPDGHGYWHALDNRCGLAHRCLATIDLATSGYQPLQGADGSLLCFNSEINNYLELREDLADGWNFRTHSDTETILHGKFSEFPGYDESPYAEAACRDGGIDLHQIEITASDFRDIIGRVIYRLDPPVARTGSFPQYMVSELAARRRDLRRLCAYLIAYLEQACPACGARALRLASSYRDK